MLWDRHIIYMCLVYHSTKLLTILQTVIIEAQSNEHFIFTSAYKFIYIRISSLQKKEKIHQNKSP